MANIIKIKRNSTSLAPTSLSNAELAFSEANQKLFYGLGAGVIEIGGAGAFVTLSTPQTISGAKTFDTAIIGSLSGNAVTATRLQNPRDFSLTGDVLATAVPFDGSGNVALAATLSPTGVIAGSYTRVTVDAKGRVSAGAQATLNDIGQPVASFSFNNQRLTSLATPINATDAATKQYVDDQVSAFFVL